MTLQDQIKNDIEVIIDELGDLTNNRLAYWLVRRRIIGRAFQLSLVHIIRGRMKNEFKYVLHSPLSLRTSEYIKVLFISKEEIIISENTVCIMDDNHPVFHCIVNDGTILLISNEIITFLINSGVCKDKKFYEFYKDWRE